MLKLNSYLFKKNTTKLLNNFSKSYSSAFTKNPFLTKQQFNKFMTFRMSSFCTLSRLNFEKMKLDGNEEILNILNPESKEKVYTKEELMFEFSPELSWEEVVLKSEIPVVIDCYAVWCNPCKKLIPMLENKLEEMKNFKLVKIDIDKHGELAEMMSINTVPTVFLLYKGNIVDSFVGLPDSKKFEEFFESISLLTGLGKDEKIIRALLTGADEYMNKKLYDRAENMLNEAYTHERWRDKFGQVIKLGLALCAFNKSDFQTAEKILKDLKLRKHQVFDPTVNKKVALLEMQLNFKKNPELAIQESDNILKEIENNPKDLMLRFKYAVHLFEQANYEQAINTLLEVIQIDRNWNNKAAQQFLIQIFNFLGSDSTLTTEGRKKLTKLLY